ncbi:zinc ribbon domain-containing protein [Pseudonocardia asaccharolytica]|nr:zinc ribbon domain-containing protein [Pseudonocardia asaccharolytica]
MGTEVGIDLGLEPFAVLPDGRKIGNPRGAEGAPQAPPSPAGTRPPPEGVRSRAQSVRTVDRWFPSTRLCSDCQALGDATPLDVREWACPCGAIHDRDVNAAINILTAGRADRSTPVAAPPDSGRPEQGPVKQEPAGSAG